jgi:exosortase H (IPTLxxWG-CTERM-specific)
MSKERHKRLKQLPSRPVGKGGVGRGRSAARESEKAADRVWLRSKKPVLRFVLIFGLLVLLFYAVFYWRGSEEEGIGRFFPWYLTRYAEASAAVLNGLGQSVEVHDRTIRSKSFHAEVVRGCDAMEAKALFVAGILAFPAPWRKKILGIIVGVSLLAILNLVRIVTLFLVGQYYRNLFPMMHIEVWQVIFILLTISLWFLWAWWATGARSSVADEQSA